MTVRRVVRANERSFEFSRLNSWEMVSMSSGFLMVATSPPLSSEHVNSCEGGGMRETL